MTFVAIFLLNAALSFALSLVVAALVGPEAFGRYAIGLSVSVVVNTALFEWLRLSATRFYSDKSRAADPAIRATLDAGYLILAAILSIALAAFLVLGADIGLPRSLVAAAVVAGLAVGLFDYATALARALFLDRAYAAIVAGRGAAAFAFAAGAAWLLGDPAAILAASAAASLAAALAARMALRDPTAAPSGATRAWAAAFARYALPLVAASAIYQLIPFANRALLASRAGFAEAGYLSLATEIATRLFQNLGSALDLALFQLAVRAEHLHGAAEAERRVGRNLGLVAAVLLPAAAGLLAVWPAFEAIFVPAAFRGEVAGVAASAVPALAAYALVQYGLNPIFQLRRRTGIVIGAALAALAVDLVLLLAWPSALRPDLVAAFQLGGFAAALAILAGLAAATGARLPWRDLTLAATGSLLMAACLWPFRETGPAAFNLPLLAVAGALLYGGFAVLTDLAGARTLLRSIRSPALEVEHR